MAELASAIAKEMNLSEYKLKGVFHAAGVLRDSPIAEMDHQQVSDVVRPKLNGFWNLHKQTKDLDLDCFVAFSSAASIHGNENQANYSAANAVMDALAYYRRSFGLVATTINWGPWGEIGMAT